MNKLVRDLYSQHAENVIREAAKLEGIAHDGLRGRFREILLENLIKPLLPPYCGCGTGTIVDHEGSSRRNSEDDIVIFDREILPPILISARDGIFPMDSVLYRIEVKSTLTKAAVGAAINSAVQIRAMKFAKNPHTKTVLNVVNALFAYKSDIQGSEHRRLQECMEEVRSDLTDYDFEHPPIPVLCVAGKGTWISGYDSLGRTGWFVVEANPDHHEVLNFAAVLVNTIANLKQSRGYPPWGAFVGDERDFKPVAVRSS